MVDDTAPRSLRQASDLEGRCDLTSAGQRASRTRPAASVGPPRQTRGTGLSRRDRDAMIVGHLNLVRMIAVRIARRLPSHVETDELTSVGMLGLIDAVDRFDAGRGTPFKAYAEIRIRGAIIDSLRQTDWVPLVVRRKLARLERSRESLRQRHGREPSRPEMASALGISPEAYDDLLGGAVVQHLVSLDEQDAFGNGGVLADRIPDGRDPLLDQWVANEAERGLQRAIQNLPEMERKVLGLYYAEHLKYREIGCLLGVCESRVCQLRGQAVERIRRAVAASD